MPSRVVRKMPRPWHPWGGCSPFSSLTGWGAAGRNAAGKFLAAGGHMLNSLLILALVTTQIASASGGSLYLCISEDRSHWCVETDPASCTCCRQQAATNELPGCCGSHADGAGDQSHGERATPHGESPELAGQPCGCTHILISHPRQSPPTLRPISRTDTQRVALLVVVLLHDQFLGGGPDPAFRHKPPPAQRQSLTILSSVVLRC